MIFEARVSTEVVVQVNASSLSESRANAFGITLGTDGGHLMYLNWDDARALRHALTTAIKAHDDVHGRPDEPPVHPEAEGKYETEREDEAIEEAENE
jgi:hypothetical protein